MATSSRERTSRPHSSASSPKSWARKHASTGRSRSSRTSYRSDDGPHHELNHVFEVTLAEDEPESRESHLEFRWLPPDELAAADLRPDAIKQLLL